MPKTAFNAIENSVSAFLGGAGVSLVELEKPDELPEARDRREILVRLVFDKVAYLFKANRDELAFTTTEISFIQELLAAFEGLYGGFSAQGYAAHFRTALLTSLTDIAVARYLRGDRKGVFWPVESLIQLLKNLSYQRYEGTPASTGFLVYRSQLDDFVDSLKTSHYNWFDLGKARQRISADFFRNPLTYRFVDGLRALFVCDIRMNVKGTIQTGSPRPRKSIEQLAWRDTQTLLGKAGEAAFAIFVNEVSEVEVVLDGGRLLVWRKGVWGVYDPDIFREFFAGHLDKRSVHSLIGSIYSLSKSRHGTVVLIAAEGTDLEALRKGSVGGRGSLSRALIEHVRGRKLGTLKRTGELSRILSSDGMTVINRKGELLDTGVIVDTSQVKGLITGGGRTTAASAASHFGHVVKVSEDGPVELYRAGKRVYRFG
ncbi:hypothetical protein [Geopsychrobacter electrodiphilus]|uniref:hypothetical protein n=1 Tax=Geopsychrobacter electrodiphilus TaxID=225196 RepID=UPI00035D94E5|nr:hypothetical protein [Geopsychrobacter electrodiphilus]